MSDTFDTAFGTPSHGLDEVFADADVVLDTSVLLLPYGESRHVLDDIAQNYGRLAKDGRLFVPKQVAIEYDRNRPDAIGRIIQSLEDVRSKAASPKAATSSLLNSVDEHARVVEAQKALDKAIGEYKSSLAALIDKARTWGRLDPVRKKYGEVLSSGVICEPDEDLEVLEEERKSRFEKRIPPGYKDASKADGGIGDFVIWKTILALAAKRKRHMVLVSGEEKSDWVTKAANYILAPRVELRNEFSANSGGKSFFLVPLSRLLELCGDFPATVESIRRQEGRPEEAFICPSCGGNFHWRLGATIGSSAIPRCPNCGFRFHAHRTSDSISIRLQGSRREEFEDRMRKWFLSHYEDPANGVPYDKEVGGYVYLDGGPYYPHDVLEETFGGIAGAESIRSVADDLVSMGGTEWIQSGQY